jgi:hypothetical protein
LNPEEVTDEASKVEILASSNPVFNWPNKITERDFTGWIEEQGSKCDLPPLYVPTVMRVPK